MNDNAKKWVEALRSDKFEQGTGKLIQPTDDGGVKHCCLGVLCEVYMEENNTLDRGEHDENYFSAAEGLAYEEALPPEVKEWAGLRTNYGAFYYQDIAARLKAEEIAGALGNDNLVDLNDGAKWTFEQIADFIESNPKGLFE
jgi:hypothetical protein